MNAKIYPSIAHGSIKVPCSKSYAHRAIICAGLSIGQSIISNIQFSDDINTTISAMTNLGATIIKHNDSLVIKGIANFNNLQHNTLMCNESGSTLRFMIPLYSLTNKSITFSGSTRLLARPLSLYKEIFKANRANFIQDDNTLIIDGAIKGGTYHIQGNVSSQFISGLLFTLPLTQEDSTIIIDGVFESKSYVLLTIQMLKRFNISIILKDNIITIKGAQTYTPCDIAVEGDYSQLAFYAVYAAINNDLDIYGVPAHSLQGDAQIIDILKGFKTKIEYHEDHYKIYKSDLVSTNIDLSNCPDLGPILCVLGMYAKGKCVISNAQRLRIKESDRIEAMECELAKFNVDIKSDESNIYLSGKNNYSCEENICAHQDHRIVMAMTIAILCANKAAIIEDAHNVNKSYPDFFKDIALIGGKVDCYD